MHVYLLVAIDVFTGNKNICILTSSAIAVFTKSKNTCILTGYAILYGTLVLNFANPSIGKIYDLL